MTHIDDSELWSPCQFLDGADLACGRRSRRLIETEGRLIPCCPIHDPGMSRRVVLEDMESLLVQEVLES